MAILSKDIQFKTTSTTTDEMRDANYVNESVWKANNKNKDSVI